MKENDYMTDTRIVGTFIDVLVRRARYAMGGEDLEKNLDLPYPEIVKTAYRVEKFYEDGEREKDVYKSEYDSLPSDLYDPPADFLLFYRRAPTEKEVERLHDQFIEYGTDRRARVEIPEEVERELKRITDLYIGRMVDPTVLAHAEESLKCFVAKKTYDEGFQEWCKGREIIALPNPYDPSHVFILTEDPCIVRALRDILDENGVEGLKVALRQNADGSLGLDRAWEFSTLRKPENFNKGI